MGMTEEQYARIYDEYITSGKGEKYFWRERYEHLEPNYNVYHGMMFREGQRRQQQTEVVDIPNPFPVAYFKPLTLDMLDDTERWRYDLAAMMEVKRYVWVMHACDMHKPYTHEGAEEAFYQLVKLVQPDVLVRGSDEDDLPTISVFAERDNDAPDIGDFLDVMQESRHYVTRRIQDAAPGALQVNIEGNHGWMRFKRWMNKSAKQSKTSLTRRYIENIRVNEDVFFIGFKESVLIHPALLVMHGKKYGDYAPKQTLQMRAMGVNIMAGHSHKPGMYTTVQANGKPVACYISGCLCDLNPHYAPEEDDNYSTWQHGTVVSMLDTYTGIVDMKHVTFNHTGNLTWFVWGNRVYQYGNEADKKIQKAS